MAYALAGVGAARSAVAFGSHPGSRHTEFQGTVLLDLSPEILLLDEVMAAGDVTFMDSARSRMNTLIERASIVVFATHSLDQLPRFCER